jgi:hypothetical protein
MTQNYLCELIRTKIRKQISWFLRNLVNQKNKPGKFAIKRERFDEKSSFPNLKLCQNDSQVSRSRILRVSHVLIHIGCEYLYFWFYYCQSNHISFLIISQAPQDTQNINIYPPNGVTYVSIYQTFTKNDWILIITPITGFSARNEPRL